MKKALIPVYLFTALIMFPQLSLAVPPPPPLPELCKDSDIIVLGKYVGGMVAKPQGCEFWVTFQVKPEKYFKQPGNMDLKILQFKKRYFIDDKKCANIPGPNAMPGAMAESLKNPTSDQKPAWDKKLFFLKNADGSLKSLTSVFWSIVDWKTAPEKWHKEFKATPACQGN